LSRQTASGSASQELGCPAVGAEAALGRKSESSKSNVATVVERFRVYAEACPDAPAVVSEAGQLCYSQLDAKSNQLAHWLRASGVQSESVVGLCLDRSPSLVVGALGILKAGGAYLPLDPELPPDRLSFLLRDSRASVLVTEQRAARNVRRGHYHVVALDSEAQRLNRMPANPLEHSARPDQLAYVIYTSGSTGAPKGVEVTHSNLLNLIDWHQRAFSVTSADRATQLAGLGFDATVWELWPYLTAGASIQVVPDSVRTAPEHLRDWLVANKITISFVPTALAEFLLALDWPRETALRILLTGADVLRRYPSATLPFQLVNNYGPTECTVVATSGFLPVEGDADTLPPIGRPITNVQAFVLDDSLRPVPNGQSGELFVGGAGVARGYRNRPDLTAERFILNPFSCETQSRLYRTGDLVRVLPDGQLAFVGRTDEQIKIAGYRIEPNEIMYTLEKHPAIQSGCVIPREDTPGNKRLVAYIVIRPGAQVSENELRNFLEQRLPSYMIPSVFVTLEMLPLTPNGKTDKGALPVPECSNVLRDALPATPRNPIEQRLAEIVSKLLGIHQPSTQDNFFLLGGHSLLGTQLIGRVREAFGVELSLRTVFDAPTIALLSAEIERLLVAKLDSMSEDEAERLLALSEEHQLRGDTD
jgi:amino acid adenylation domain-containing protein